MNEYAQMGRVRQKERTRSALVAAARELMAEMDAPTVTQISERAGVSPATAYRYFATQEALMAEAAMAPLVSSLERAAAEAEAFTDPVDGLDHFLAAVLDELSAHESVFRLLYARSLEAPPTRGLEREMERGMGRAGRRPRWIGRILAPLRPKLGDPAFERLVRAVTVAVGIEALSALRDVCGLSLDEARDVMRWSALSLVDAARRKPD